MDTSSNEIVTEIPNFIRIFKDGTLQRLHVTNIVPAGTDPTTAVESKDIIFSPENNIFARIYIPPNKTSDHKSNRLPLIIFYHGGGFCIESARSSLYHNFLNLVVSESNVVAVSVDYRLAPEFPLPIAYEDSWDAIKWVGKHVNGNGPESWLNEYADFKNVFLAGDSAGGNIAHHMAIRVGSGCPDGLEFKGVILFHPYFWGKERIDNESKWIESGMVKNLDNLWAIANPGSSGLDDPLINPEMDPRIAAMGCSRILVCVAGDDFMRDRDWNYKKIVEESGWNGELEIAEDKGEEHVFFLIDPDSANARALRTRVCNFINKI
ncbi:alpha/beta hydrolase fold-3 [Tanacetum coccineum]